MSRLNVPSADKVPDGTQGILDNARAQFGFVPNMFATLASNPTVLDVVTTLQRSVSRVLDAKTRHTIDLAVSQANGCDYCLAMHTYVSSELGGMSSDDIDLARADSSIDPKRAAVARFAQRVVEAAVRSATPTCRHHIRTSSRSASRVAEPSPATVCDGLRT